ncbi:MAG TPA: hypothetical protein VMU84_21435, partial [Thermoanaerobaculia bacterium]|nr:hypothetical protein [Thermoanaerobaculia bacterium]
MIVFALMVIALVIVGVACVRALWTRLDPEGAARTTPLEWIAAGALFGVAGWLAMQWVFALTHTLRAIPLWTSVVLLLGAAIVIVIRHARRFPLPPNVLFLIPLALWIAFILWRGLILPPLSHDALAYHLPKAVLLERAGGYELFHAPDARIDRFPFNYELLLADVLILSGTDTYTEWIGTVSYVFFLLATAALAQRWWRSSANGIIAAILCTGGAPILLLHSGAHKNDLLVAWFSLCALMWGSRWIVEGGQIPLLLTIMAVAFGIGTKTTVAAIAVALVPFMIWQLIRRRDVVFAGFAFLACFTLGGGVTLAANYLTLGDSSGVTSMTTTATKLTAIAYGDWNNFWQVPYLLLTVPFSRVLQGVWVPWDSRYWYWPHYEIYFSHYGEWITILAVLVPFAIWRYRRTGQTRERWIASCAALLAVIVMLPTQIRPLGFFGTFARYFCFIVPIVVCLVVPPVIDEVATRSRRLVHVAMAVFLIIFTMQAVTCGVLDRFAPIEYVRWVAEHPGTRIIYFQPSRAGSVVDRLAGPHDTVAVDGAFDTWVYPAYGRNRTRPVVFLAPGTTPDRIPPEAKW